MKRVCKECGHPKDIEAFPMVRSTHKLKSGEIKVYATRRLVCRPCISEKDRKYVLMKSMNKELYAA